MQPGLSLELKQRQQLALTPELRQSIRLLRLSAQDLDAEIARVLEENPALQRQQDDGLGDVGQYDIEAPDGKDPPEDASGLALESSHWPVAPNGEWHRGGPPEMGAEETLSDHLLGQLRLTRATPRDCLLVGVLVRELDENGYLPMSLATVAAAFPDVAAADDEWRAALRLLQSFDPAGVGARTPGECLLLQLDRWPQRVPAPVMACACRIARDHLALLAAGDIARLCAVLACARDTARAAHALLLRLDPLPGRAWAATVASAVVPDILVRRARGVWQAYLNPALVPRLTVDPLYEHLPGNDPGSVALRDHARQAHSFVRGLRQRHGTVLAVSRAIVRRQQDFFARGAGAMRPLLLRDVARELALHESTVSRATRGKYAQTPRGVIELKRFFGAALVTGDGGTTSGAAVRSLITGLVADEDGENPLSDSQIVARLADLGVVLARRTVAKYRDAAGIEPAPARKARAALAKW